jgi:hypothetical protein
MATEDPCQILAAECIVASAFALVELAEAQAALTIAEQKCAEFEACLLEQNENPPIPESQMSQPEDDSPFWEMLPTVKKLQADMLAYRRILKQIKRFILR